jgi:hypothetical protein
VDHIRALPAATFSAALGLSAGHAAAGPVIAGVPGIDGTCRAYPNETGFSRAHADGDGFCGETCVIDDGAFDLIPLAPTTGPAVAVPTTAPHGSAVEFTVTPASGKTVTAAWCSVDAVAHLNTWNSRSTNPTFFYPSAGTFSPLVKITYADGSTETVQRTGYMRAT